jgi:hypothetical protein
MAFCAHTSCSVTVEPTGVATCGEMSGVGAFSCDRVFCDEHLYYIPRAGRCLCRDCCDKWERTHKRCRCRKYRMPKAVLTGRGK